MKDFKFSVNICQIDFDRNSLGTGNGELLELRLLETGFLSRFQLNP
jgi:hypothetical protein